MKYSFSVNGFLLLMVLSSISASAHSADKKLPLQPPPTHHARTTFKEVIRPRRYLDYLPPPSTSYYKSNNPPMYAPQYGYNEQYYNYYRPPTPYVPNPYMYSPQPQIPNYYVPRNPPTMYNNPVMSNRGYPPYPYSPEPYGPPPMAPNYYNTPMYPMPMPNYPQVPPSYSYPQSNFDTMSSVHAGQYDSNPPYPSGQSYQSYQQPESSSGSLEQDYPAEKPSQLATAEASSRKDMNAVKKENVRDKV